VLVMRFYECRLQINDNQGTFTVGIWNFHPLIISKCSRK
jgi:hypothetical protein